MPSFVNENDQLTGGVYIFYILFSQIKEFKFKMGTISGCREGVSGCQGGLLSMNEQFQLKSVKSSDSKLISPGKLLIYES